MILCFRQHVRAISWIVGCLLFVTTFFIEQPAFALKSNGNGVNVIIMIGDGMGWEPARAAAIANGGPFYTRGKGSGLNMQKLRGYTYATTYGTTIFDQRSGRFSTANSALDGSNAVTGQSNIRPGFSFKPMPFNPGNDLSASASGGATDPSLGNLTGWEVERGGPNPWTPATPQPCEIEVPSGQSLEAVPERYTCQAEYIKLSLPDSANTAMTLYTGVKSYNNSISVDIFERPVETILQTARKLGKSTGLLTSVPISHATPGSAEATVNRRAKYDADFPTLDNILQQAIRPDFNNNPDRPDLKDIFLPTVLMGGGHPLDHDNTVNTPGQPGYRPPGTCNYVYVRASTYKELSGKTSLSDEEACLAPASSNPYNRYGYTFLERSPNSAQLLRKTSRQLDPNKGDRLLALYGARGQEGNIPISGASGDYSYTGLANFARQSSLYYKTTPYKRGELPVNDTDRPLQSGESTEQFIAREVNENPTLADLTEAALNVLGKDPDGFWLMVEGGDIDWGIHDNNMENIIGTTLDFDRSVGTVINWIQRHGGWKKNVLVVTADHDHYLTLYPNFPNLLRTKGAKALTFGSETDSASVGHSFGSIPEDKYGWGNHTRRPVPVYYQGEPFKLDKYISQGYKAYGFDIPGLQGGVDEAHIYKAMYEAITGNEPDDNYKF